MEEIFDGIQRPLEVIANISKSVFVPRGVDVPALNGKKMWTWAPDNNVKVGSLLSGGDKYGSVYENELFDEHRILVPPKGRGKVKFIAPPGNYTIHDTILELEYDNKV